MFLTPSSLHSLVYYNAFPFVKLAQENAPNANQPQEQPAENQQEEQRRAPAERPPIDFDAYAYWFGEDFANRILQSYSRRQEGPKFTTTPLSVPKQPRFRSTLRVPGAFGDVYTFKLRGPSSPIYNPYPWITERFEGKAQEGKGGGGGGLTNEQLLLTMLLRDQNKGQEGLELFRKFLELIEWAKNRAEQQEQQQQQQEPKPQEPNPQESKPQEPNPPKPASQPSLPPPYRKERVLAFHKRSQLNHQPEVQAPQQGENKAAFHKQAQLDFRHFFVYPLWYIPGMTWGLLGAGAGALGYGLAPYLYQEKVEVSPRRVLVGALFGGLTGAAAEVTLRALNRVLGGSY